MSEIWISNCYKWFQLHFCWEIKFGFKYLCLRQTKFFFFFQDFNDPCPYSLSPVTIKSQKLLRSPRKATRKISRIPFKVLDAPELQDDFYLNLVDWSAQNVLAVGLGSCVYLWSACTSQVSSCFYDNLEIPTSLAVWNLWFKVAVPLKVGTKRDKTVSLIKNFVLFG